MFDRLPPKRMCLGSRDLFKCWEISDHRFSRLGRTPTCERRTDSQPFETFAEKYLPNDVSTVVLTVEKIFTVVTPKKTKKSPSVRNCSNQEEKRHPKTSACTHDQRSDISLWVMIEKTPVWYMSITKSRLLRALMVTWCCYSNDCLPYVRSQASSPSFSRTVPGTHGAWCNQLSYS